MHGIFVLPPRLFLFDSQGRVLQAIIPIVLNTPLKHEKEKINYQQHIQSIIQIHLLLFSL